MFPQPKRYLVHDPNSSLRTGDIVAITPGWRTSQHKRHVVKHIIAPFGTPIEKRPPIPSQEERIAEREQKRATKDERRAARKDETRKVKESHTGAA
jgi:small subunit ribosomal protein S17